MLFRDWRNVHGGGVVKVAINLKSIFLILSLSVFSIFCFAESNPLRQEFTLEEKNEYGTRNYFGDIAFTLMGRRMDDSFVSSRWGRAIIEANLGGKYSDWLEGRLSVVQLMTSGAASYQMGVTEGGPSSGLLLDEATMTVSPVSWLKGTAGVVSVELNPIYSQFYPQSQAGGQITLENTWTPGWGSVKATLWGTQSIPTAKNSGHLIVDESTNPLLTTGTLFSEVQNDVIGAKFRVSATHFEFTDLSSAAAADAVRTGSSVVGTKDMQFLYEYRGKEYAAAYKQKMGLSHELELKASRVRNERAPAGLNEGEQVKVEYTRTFDKWQIIPSINFFRMESDALPSVYSLAAVGFTNRKGYGAGLKANFPKEKFNVFAGYTNANAIREAGIVQTNTDTSTYQVDREIYTLGAEVQYDIF